MNSPFDIKDVNLTYYYVKSFRWFDSTATIGLNGHPMENTIYRGYFNKSVKCYYLYYRDQNDDKPNVLILPNLKGGKSFSCEIVEIKKSNVLSFDISEEQLDKIISWQTSNNDDIRGKDEPKMKLTDSLSQHDVDKINTIQNFFKEAKTLFDQQPMIFEAYYDLLEVLNRNLGYGNSLDTINISLSREHGAGYNVGKALESLAIYMNESKRIGLLEDDLDDALLNLMNEKARIRYPY